METIANPGTGSLAWPEPRRRTHRTPLSIHRSLPLAAAYFFLNSAGLPLGLFYTTLFAPVLFVWLYLRGQRWLTTQFFLILSPFLLAHLVLGVESPLYYVRTLALLWTVFIASYALCWGLTRFRNIDRLFDELIVLNFMAALLAIILRPTPLRALLWQDDTGTLAASSHLLRLNLLSSEPAVYAMLMLPLLLFALLRLLQASTKRSLGYALMIAVPFMLCQSFGGIGLCIAGIAAAVALAHRRQLRRPRTLALILCGLVLLAGLLVTHNPISARLLQVASGGDSSARSRTIFSFVAAWAVASAKSIWWGAGLGQTKLLNFSQLNIGFTVNVIPNAVAGTFAELGLMGVLVRFGVEFALFFRTRVYSNSFRTAMFTVVFLAQLTGGYLADVQEYVMWFLAFSPLFPQFDNEEAARSKA